MAALPYYFFLPPGFLGVTINFASSSGVSLVGGMIGSLVFGIVTPSCFQPLAATGCQSIRFQARYIDP